MLRRLPAQGQSAQMDIKRWTVIFFALRAPLLSALALASIAPLGAFSFSPFRSMLEGLFDLTAWGAFWAGLFSCLTAAACWICSLLILNYGPRRIPGMRRIATDLEFRPFPWLAAGYSLAPAFLLSGVLAVSVGGWGVVFGAAAGFGTSVGAWRLLSNLHLQPGKATRLMRFDPAGYLDKATGRLLPGHWIAVQFTALYVVGWSLIGLLKYYSLTVGIESVFMPSSLAFVVILVGLFALILSGLSFFFDRYRVPVLLPWLALLAATSLIPGTDHFVRTASHRPASAPSPTEILAYMQAPVLVCASGGGIAAAAWTAQVLSALDRQNPRRFSSAFAFFSGASGGSVGGLQFLAACRSDEGCAAAFDRASRSSLDAVAWGVVGPDLLRAVVPFAGTALGEVGPGWALDQAWDPGRILRAPISSWAGQPALSFNTTVVETGEGLSLSNIDFGSPVNPALVSSARLSASFPFVTPTPKVDSLGLHLADGGYYDNYGVGAAVEFLTRAYSVSTQSLPPRLLLIEIRASRHSSESHSPVLLFQWLSPFYTMLNVRDTAQRHRNDATLSLLQQAMAARGVQLDRLLFEIPRDNVPLSWHLTATQIEALRRDWSERYEDSSETRTVTRFLSQQH